MSIITSIPKPSPTASGHKCLNLGCSYAAAVRLRTAIKDAVDKLHRINQELYCSSLWDNDRESLDELAEVARCLEEAR